MIFGVPWTDYSEGKQKEIELCNYRDLTKLKYVPNKGWYYGMMVKLPDGRDVYVEVDNTSTYSYFISLHDIDELCISQTGYRSVIPFKENLPLEKLPEFIKAYVNFRAEETKVEIEKQSKKRKHKK